MDNSTRRHVVDLILVGNQRRESRIATVMLCKFPSRIAGRMGLRPSLDWPPYRAPRNLPTYRIGAMVLTKGHIADFGATTHCAPLCFNQYLYMSLMLVGSAGTKAGGQAEILWKSTMLLGNWPPSS